MKNFIIRGCAHFAKNLQNCEVHQVFGRESSMVFLDFTLKLPIQTLLSVAPTRSVFWPYNFSKTDTPRDHLAYRIL